MGINPTAEEQAQLLPRIKNNARKASRKVAANHHVIMGDEGEVIEFDAETFQNKKVITVMHAKDTCYTIPSPKVLGYKLTKLHIEHCENCIFNIEHQVITQHIEVSHCTNVTLNVDAPLATLQLDTSEDISVNYGEGIFRPETKIIHAGVKAMRVTHENFTHHADCVEDAARLKSQLPQDEIQFMTTMVSSGFITQRVARKGGDLLPSPVEDLGGESNDDSPTEQNSSDEDAPKRHPEGGSAAAAMKDV
mmetsp:Transcript_13936/g.15883  ORF Transcript_13936/g.15883 Transcript_13936/m.15883 type:complete len:249 (+) Transcript_13936:278-1024(+)|eukprot:CAMPEP_0184011666 /NCGR_PEP_ID=MMETSP0954-20121128/3956_1 /TAXON_ID=627963 /ORGANISM="Aplanochytrium sp, Strain PBS07" /LENGTH=248 /DNA_ID=CAMNT_0026291513 /DNA_START=242 /DNA_END=988 /DNA_ORIENTATION=-